MGSFKPITGEQYRRMAVAEIAGYSRAAPDLTIVPLPTEEEMARIWADLAADDISGPGDKPAGQSPTRFQIAFSELDDDRE